MAGEQRIGEKFNYDEVFFRDLTVCVLDTMEGRIKWTNRFTSGDINVNVPFYYSLTGDERFLLDSFADDVVSTNRFIELNTDIIPRGHITLSNWTINSDEFANPNVWLRTVVENETEIKKYLSKVRAIPITANYNLSILVRTEIDVFKASQSIMDTLWLYRYMYFEYNFMNIDAIMLLPDSETIEIQREQNMSVDNSFIKISVDFEVHTYYPAFITNEPSALIEPRKTKWFSNILRSREESTSQKAGGLPYFTDLQAPENGKGA